MRNSAGYKDKKSAEDGVITRGGRSGPQGGLKGTKVKPTH